MSIDTYFFPQYFQKNTTRSRTPNPAELAEDLLRPRPGRGWSAVRGALQFAELLEEDDPRVVPASCVTTGPHPTFEHMVRTHGRSPNTSLLLCSLFSDALGLPQEAYLDVPRTREREVITATASVWPRTPSDHGISCSSSQIGGSTSDLTSESLYQTSTSNRNNAIPDGPSGSDMCLRKVMRCLLFQRRRQTRWGQWARG